MKENASKISLYFGDCFTVESGEIGMSVYSPPLPSLFLNDNMCDLTPNFLLGLMKVGDRVVEVNGMEVMGKDPDEVINYVVSMLSPSVKAISIFTWTNVDIDNRED